MRQRFCLLSVIMAAACTTAAVAGDDEARPNEVPGWGRVMDPWRDCDVSLDREHDRLKIQVPGTPHVLSAEVLQLSMNAPRVVRRVRGDFTAGVRVLGRLEPGRSRTTHYDPYHGAGLIVWQDPSNYLRLERAVGFIKGRDHPYVNYELREGGLLAVRAGSRSRRFPVPQAPATRPGILGLVQPRWTPMDRARAGRRDLHRSGRGRGRRRQLLRRVVVGRAGDVEHRGYSGFDRPGLPGPRTGRAVAAPCRHRRK